MKEIVLKYLNNNYRLSVASLKDYRVYNIKDKKSETILNVFKTLRTIFALKTEELESIFHPWMENKVIELNNRITEIQYKIYEATGVEIKLTPEQLAELIESETSAFNFVPYLPME